MPTIFSLLVSPLILAHNSQTAIIHSTAKLCAFVLLLCIHHHLLTFVVLASSSQKPACVQNSCRVSQVVRTHVLALEMDPSYAAC